MSYEFIITTLSGLVMTKRDTKIQQSYGSLTHKQMTLTNQFFNESIKKTQINHTTQCLRGSWLIKPTKTTTKGIKTGNVCSFLSELSFCRCSCDIKRLHQD